MQSSITFLIKETCGSGTKNENIYNKELAEELQKAIIEKFDKKVHLPLIDNICGADLEDINW